MYSTASQMNMLSRNIQPVVAGSTDDGPLPFSRHHHDIDNPLSPVLAIARVGGEGGPVYVYSEERGAEAGATFGGGGRRVSQEAKVAEVWQRLGTGRYKDGWREIYKRCDRERDCREWLGRL